MNPAASKLVRILKWTLGIIIGVPLCLYLLLLIINIKDDEFAPDVQKIHDLQPPTAIPSKDNGYFAFVGIMAPENQPPHAWGEAVFQELLTTDKALTASWKGSESTLQKNTLKETLKRGENPCNPIDDCLKNVAANPKAAETALEKGKVTLSRGDAAMRFSAYQEPWRPDESNDSLIAPVPHLLNPLAATRFALSVEKGNHDEALAALEREIGFLTRQMNGTYSVLGRNFVQIGLMNRYQLLSQYMTRHPEAAQKRAGVIAEMLVPLAPETVSLKPVLLGMARFSIRFCLNVKTRPNENLGTLLLIPLYLPKASANLYFSWFKPSLDTEASTGEDYRKKLAEIRKNSNSTKQQVYSIRNPIGHILNSGDFPPFYITQLLDRDNLLATRTLVAFQLDMLKSGTSQPEAIAKAVESSAMQHPSTGSKAKWDAEKRTLGFSDLPGGKELIIHL